jgi:hypothetical protein
MDKLLKDSTVGEKIILVSGIVLFIDGFFHWYSVDLGVLGTFSRNGWQSPGAFWSVVAILIGLVMVAQIVLARLGTVDFPEKIGGLTWGTIHLILGGVALLFLIIKIINESSSLAFGYWLGLICSIGLAAGGYLFARETGGLPGTLGGSAGGATPPAA